MISYYCIVNMPGVPVREITAFSAADDAAARDAAGGLAARWPGYETVALYEGERVVDVIANASLGFATEPFFVQSEAA